MSTIFGLTPLLYISELVHQYFLVDFDLIRCFNTLNFRFQVNLLHCQLLDQLFEFYENFGLVLILFSFDKCLGFRFFDLVGWQQCFSHLSVSLGVNHDGLDHDIAPCLIIGYLLKPYTIKPSTVHDLFMIDHKGPWLIFSCLIIKLVFQHWFILSLKVFQPKNFYYVRIPFTITHMCVYEKLFFNNNNIVDTSLSKHP